MNSIKHLSLFLVLVVSFWSSCTNDSNSTATGEETPDIVLTKEKLQGDWNLTHATKEGKETSLMDGMFMNFSGNGNMVTNFTGEEVDAAYQLQDKKITHNELVYNVEKFEASEMILSTNLLDIDFKITLAKTTELDQ